MYINCKTWYSLRYGTYSTEDLVQAALDRGLTALGLTNINTTADTWEFVKLCREAGIKPIIGVEVRNDHKLLYILLAANNQGLTAIHEFLSVHIIADKPFPEPATNPEFFTHPQDGFVIYPLGVYADELDHIRPEQIDHLFWWRRAVHV